MKINSIKEQNFSKKEANIANKVKGISRFQKMR